MKLQPLVRKSRMSSIVLFCVRLLPGPGHRFALRIAHQARAWLYRQLHITTYGCTVIAQDEQGALLLVRHGYVDQETWTLPGGGIDQRETPTAAARRELAEELSCSLERPRFYELEDAVFWGLRYVTCMITGLIEGGVKPDGREIIEARFFSVADLPANMCPISGERIARWQRQMAAETAAENETIAMTTVQAQSC